MELHHFEKDEKNVSNLHICSSNKIYDDSKCDRIKTRYFEIKSAQKANPLECQVMGRFFISHKL